jgi:hypothetical protein
MPFRHDIVLSIAFAASSFSPRLISGRFSSFRYFLMPLIAAGHFAVFYFHFFLRHYAITPIAEDFRRAMPLFYAADISRQLRHIVFLSSFAFFAVLFSPIYADVSFPHCFQLLRYRSCISTAAIPFSRFDTLSLRCRFRHADID